MYYTRRRPRRPFMSRRDRYRGKRKNNTKKGKCGFLHLW